MIANNQGHVNVVKVLLTQNAVVNIQDKGWSYGLLITAINQRYVDVVKELLSKKDNKGSTTLIVASCKGHTDIVRQRLDRGINLDIQQENGATALIFFITRSRCE